MREPASVPDHAASFSVADNGALVYVSGAGGGVGRQRSLVWVDREGGETPLASPLLGYTRPRVSPDGTRVAVEVGDGGSSDIWIHDLERGTEAILTTDATTDRAPLRGRHDELAATDAPQVGGAHQARDALATHPPAPRDQLRMDPRGPIGPARVAVNRLNLRRQRGVLVRPLTRCAMTIVASANVRRYHA